MSTEDCPPFTAHLLEPENFTLIHHKIVKKRPDIIQAFF